MNTYICYNAGSDIFEIEKFNPKIDWHNDEFKGTYSECVAEKESNEDSAYRFGNCLPANGNEDTLMQYHY